jgi:hypothetical protein
MPDASILVKFLSTAVQSGSVVAYTWAKEMYVRVPLNPACVRSAAELALGIEVPTPFALNIPPGIRWAVYIREPKSAVTAAVCAEAFAHNIRLRLERTNTIKTKPKAFFCRK